MRPGTIFEFDLHIENLSEFELGGEVRVAFDASRLTLPPAWPRQNPSSDSVVSGRKWSSTRNTLVSPTRCPGDDTHVVDAKSPTTSPARRAETGVRSGDGPRQPKLLQAFRRAAEGFAELPVHYPRLNWQQPGDGEHL